MMMTGAIAISGTDRSSIATGMSAASAPLLSWKIAAAMIAATRPAMKPIAASPSVTMRLPMISSRLAAAFGTVKK